MKFKVLKHKTLPDTFGVFQTEYSSEEGEVRKLDTAIYHSTTPQLLGIDATIEDLKTMYYYDFAIHQLEDYELVTVQVTFIN